MPLEPLGPPSPLDRYAIVIDAIAALWPQLDGARDYATVWTTNYIALYERPGQDNKKLLAGYLFWRFHELAGLYPVSAGVGL